MRQSLKSILLAALAGGIAAALWGCGGPPAQRHEPPAAQLQRLKTAEFRTVTKGIIVPHHLLVAAFMEKFFAGVAEQNSYDRVILLSPNHFGLGHNFIQSTREGAGGIDLAAVDSLVQGKLLYVENGDLAMEHGLHAQYPFIAKYFPGAKVLPIMIKKDTPCEVLDRLAAGLLRLDRENPGEGEGGRTLIVASLDFTHYSGEEIALANDLASLEWLAKSAGSGDHSCEAATRLARGMDSANPEAVAIDSGEVIYLTRKLMEGMEAGTFSLWQRTSSAGLLPGLPAGENTSHLFGYFWASY